MRTLVIALLIAAAHGLALGASAPYPQRPIRWIMPYPVGGTIDMTGRVLAREVSESIGQQVVVGVDAYRRDARFIRDTRRVAADHALRAVGEAGNDAAAHTPPLFAMRRPACS